MKFKIILAVGLFLSSAVYAQDTTMRHNSGTKHSKSKKMASSNRSSNDSTSRSTYSDTTMMNRRQGQ